MQVLGVMSHKAACAIETVKGGRVGHPHKNIKDNCADIHSRYIQTQLSTVQTRVCLWQTSFWCKSIPVHMQKHTHTENEKKRGYASPGRKHSPTPT